MANKVLITGATGFVGACIARRLLKEKYEVNVTTRESSDLWRLQDVIKDLKIYNTNLLDTEGVHKLAKSINVDVVFHLATYGGTHFEQDIDKIINTNLLGTWNLFREFSKKDIKMFINTSSSSEYGEKKLPMNEEMIVEPNNMYGASKASSTMLCSTYSKLNKVPLVTLRLFSPYGYFDTASRLIPTVIAGCLLDKEIRLSRKDSKRDFIFIDDVIDSYMSMINLNESYGEVFNIGSGIQYSVEQITNNIVKNIGANAKIVWNNDFKRQYEPEIWVSDNTKVLSKTKWKPKVSIDEGLTKTINWFKDNLDLYR